jgi:pimeloyl-ACP methyl ester carboxylesterase
LSVPVEGGEIAGWVNGSGLPVLLLHGGPGLSFDYLDGLADEIGEGFEAAGFQQRGLAPSTLHGPFDIPTTLADIRAVLDALGWERSYVVGHSWGGHLAFHVAAAMPERLLGVVSVDPLGVVGDGGLEKFGAEMMARCPADIRATVEEMDAAGLAGEPVAEGAAIALYWPAYFPDWDSAPPMPPMQTSSAVYRDCFASLTELRGALEASLSSIAVPFGIVAGAKSPMPAHESAELSAAAIPGAWAEVVADAGHFPWLDKPGCVRAALTRVVAG